MTGYTRGDDFHTCHPQIIGLSALRFDFYIHSSCDIFLNYLNSLNTIIHTLTITQYSTYRNTNTHSLHTSFSHITSFSKCNNRNALLYDFEYQSKLRHAMIFFFLVPNIESSVQKCCIFMLSDQAATTPRALIDASHILVNKLITKRWHGNTIYLIHAAPRHCAIYMWLATRRVACQGTLLNLIIFPVFNMQHAPKTHVMPSKSRTYGVSKLIYLKESANRHSQYAHIWYIIYLSAIHLIMGTVSTTWPYWRMNKFTAVSCCKHRA